MIEVYYHSQCRISQCICPIFPVVRVRSGGVATSRRASGQKEKQRGRPGAVRRILHGGASKARQLSAPPVSSGRNAPPWTHTSSASDWWSRGLSTSGKSVGRPEGELCSAGGGRWLLRPRHAVVSVEHHQIGFWRGYAASGHSGPRKHNPGQRGGGGGGRGPSFHAVVNQEITAAQTVEVLLGLVVEHEARFDFINVSTAVSTLAKLASKRATRVGRTPVGKMLREDAGFAKLIDLVKLHCGAFGGQEIGNVLNGLAALHTNLGVMSVNDGLAEQLAKIVEQVAHKMNAQEIANTLNAFSKVEAAASAMSQAGWAATARAAERVAPTMFAQVVGNTLNALSKVEAAAGAMSPAGWDAMARAAKHTAPRMNQQEVGNTLNALSKVEAAAVAMSPAGWAAMARAAKHTAPTMNAQGVGNTLNALSKVEAAAGAMSPAGWAAMARAVERTALTMNAQDLANSLAAIASLPNARAKMSESAFKRLEAAGVKLASEMNSKETEMTRWACQKFFRA